MLLQREPEEDYTEIPKFHVKCFEEINENLPIHTTEVKIRDHRSLIKKNGVIYYVLVHKDFHQNAKMSEISTSDMMQEACQYGRLLYFSWFLNILFKKVHEIEKY